MNIRFLTKSLTLLKCHDFPVNIPGYKRKKIGAPENEDHSASAGKTDSSLAHICVFNVKLLPFKNNSKVAHAPGLSDKGDTLRSSLYHLHSSK